MRNRAMWCVMMLGIARAACGGPPAEAIRESGAAPQTAAVIKTTEPPKELTVDLGGGVKMVLVLIPAGKFMMGAKGGVWTEPVHEATIARPFYIGKYEVTQEQWQAVMGNNPSLFKGPKNPVDSVVWKDCRGFVARLNEKLKASGATFDLPTEAQWEYACRAGTTTTWSFGNDDRRLGDYAWWAQNSEGTTHPVGRKKPNAWGLYDMHGNVAEWCAGGAEGFDRQRRDDGPLRPKSGDPVLRGGSRFYGSALSASACRHYMIMMGLREGDAGFRVVKNLAR